MIFVHSINQRILKGLRIKYEDNPKILGIVNKKFEDVPKPQKTEIITPAPPGAVWKVWRYLIDITP
jgi:hypothetical protein